MKAISQFVVRVADLFEAEAQALGTVLRAEARHAHSVLLDTAVAATLLLIGVPLIVSGFGLLAAAIYLWLEPMLGRPLAACSSGCGLLFIGAGCVLLFTRCSNRRRA
ncbi:MAG: hypothetical protein ACOYN0_06230 [Phycisphaerales bacterium]